MAETSTSLNSGSLSSDESRFFQARTPSWVLSVFALCFDVVDLHFESPRYCSTEPAFVALEGIVVFLGHRGLLGANRTLSRFLRGEAMRRPRPRSLLLCVTIHDLLIDSE